MRLELKRRTTVWTHRARVEKRVDLSLEEAVLGGAEELFGLRQGQPEMLDTSVVFVEGDDIGDGLFMTLIAAHDELKFDTHTGASPGLSGRQMIQAIVPEVIRSPQHLPALFTLRKTRNPFNRTKDRGPLVGLSQG